MLFSSVVLVLCNLFSPSVALVYKCKACRHPLATCQNTLPHQVCLIIIVMSPIDIVIIVIISIIVVIVILLDGS